jgi:acyl-CoA thioesterase FadM
LGEFVDSKRNLVIVSGNKLSEPLREIGTQRFVKKQFKKKVEWSLMMTTTKFLIISTKMTMEFLQPMFMKDSLTLKLQFSSTGKKQKL